MMVWESFFRNLAHTAPGRNLGFFISLLNSRASLCCTADEKCRVIYLTKGTGCGFSFLYRFYFVPPVFIQAPAYFTNSSLSSSVEWRHFLPNVLCEGTLDSKHVVMMQRDRRRESEFWNYSISCADCQAPIWVNLFYCSFSSNSAF